MKYCYELKVRFETDVDMREDDRAEKLKKRILFALHPPGPVKVLDMALYWSHTGRTHSLVYQDANGNWRLRR